MLLRRRPGRHVRRSSHPDIVPPHAATKRTAACQLRRPRLRVIHQVTLLRLPQAQRRLEIRAVGHSLSQAQCIHHCAAGALAKRRGHGMRQIPDDGDASNRPPIKMRGLIDIAPPGRADRGKCRTKWRTALGHTAGSIGSAEAAASARGAIMAKYSSPSSHTVASTRSVRGVNAQKSMM
jgi:hypothetical protein